MSPDNWVNLIAALLTAGGGVATAWITTRGGRARRTDGDAQPNQPDADHQRDEH